VDQPKINDEDASRWWQALVTGQYRFLGGFSEGSRCFGRLGPREPGEVERFSLNARCLTILERVLRGERQKAVAIDLGISDAAVANTLAGCRRKLGVACRSAELPIALVLLAQAARAGRQVTVSSRAASGEVIVSFKRPDATLLRTLTEAEAEVVSGLLEGLSQREIARVRNARWRTVVNQLATARRKLPVTSRVELVHFLSDLRAP
jgi:DNA-binding CsgD family transcriptional regulator